MFHLGVSVSDLAPNASGTSRGHFERASVDHVRESLAIVKVESPMCFSLRRVLDVSVRPRQDHGTTMTRLGSSST